MDAPDWLRTPLNPLPGQSNDPDFRVGALFDAFDLGSLTHGYRLFDLPPSRDALAKSMSGDGWLQKHVFGSPLPDVVTELGRCVTTAPLVFVTLPIAKSVVRHANRSPTLFTLAEASRRLTVPTALCFFERPLTFRSHTTSATLSVNAILWKRRESSLSVYLLQQCSHRDWWLSRGNGRWNDDDSREEGCTLRWVSAKGDADLAHLEVGPVIRRILAALWAIAAEPRAADVRDRPASRAAARTARRAGREPELIKVIDMRAPVATKHRTDGPGFSVEWSHRWEVNAHLKLQPCGPGNQDRELILVPAHIKGPADKPLVRKETIRVIR